MYEHVLLTASSPGLGVTHRVAAWNTLCALIDRCCIAIDDGVQQLLWEGKVWNRSFDLYLSQGHYARPKSSRQLLSTLTTALRKNEKVSRTTGPEHEIASRLLEILATNEDPGRAKTSALALGHLLAKDVLTLSTILNACGAFQRTQASVTNQPKL